MNDLLPFLVLGLTTGALYGLAGLGLVLTYRTSGVFNFAHGATAAAAAFVFYTLHDQHQVAWPLAAAVTVVLFGVVVGTIMEVLTRTMPAASSVAVVVLTVGLILAIEGVLFIRYGDLTRNFPSFLPQTGFHLAGVIVRWEQVISAGIAVIAAGGLYAFLRFSRIGACMRAVVDSPTLVSLTGENPHAVARVAWIVGTSFAALSGILLAPTLGLDATLLTLLVVQSFGACAIGTFKNLPMTFAGGLVVGVVASVATKYLTRNPWSALPSTVPLLILIVVLLVVPSHRLPRPRTGLRSLIVPRPRPRPMTTGATVAVTAGALVIVPFVVGAHLPIWIGALTYFVIFGSLGLLLWTSGQVSLCHLAFVAFGATTLGHLTHAGIPWLPALFLAGLLTVPVGALIAVPAIRVSGIYLALVTIGFAIFMQNVVFPTGAMFGASANATASRPTIGFVHGADDRWFYFVALAIASVVAVALVAIQRGQLGRFLRAVAENPTLLVTNGLSVNMTKLLVFCLSAFFAAIGGGLLVTQFGAVSGEGFGPLQSLILVAVLGICGTALLRSSMIAATLMVIVPGYVSSFGQDGQLLLFGLAAVVAGLALGNRSVIAEWFAGAGAESGERLAHGPVTSRRALGPRPRRPADPASAIDRPLPRPT